MSDEVIKKCENIDKAKEDLSLIEQFDKLYSNFMIGKKSPKIPKIIKDEEPSAILNANEEEEIFLDDKNLYDDNFTNLILRKPSFELKKKNREQNSDYNIENGNDSKNKIIKSIIESSKELLSKRILSNEIKEYNQLKINNNKKEEFKNGKMGFNNINAEKRKEKKMQIKNLIEKMKKSKHKNKIIKSKEKLNKAKIYNEKYNNDKKKSKDKEKRTMKDIYKHLYGFMEDNSISINSGKKYNIKNTHERLYNQGFYSKNKSQINILENINKIKKDCNHRNISQKSKELLGLNKKAGSKNNNNINKKYDKNNIFKPIKLKTKEKSFEFSFHPELNKNSMKIVKNMENPFIRLTKPKNKITAKTPKKIISKKEDYEKCLKRINILYLDGVEKLKKRKIYSCHPTEISEETSEFELKKNNLKAYKLKNSRNTYYNQIQWKKKIIFENIKKKEIFDFDEKSECTFRPEIIKGNMKKIFKKQLSDADLYINKNKNNFDIYFGPKIKEFNVSKQRYFIINNDDVKNTKISLYYKKDRNAESEKRNRYNEKNINLCLIKRKLYNLEKFFSKQSI